jgi:hypothetical protein
MKTALALALLLWAAPLPSAAADAEFDPKEKITVDLKDAKIADLVTTLGALANMPVYIDPDVSGTITIKMEDVPFEKVLKLVNVKTGVFVRIENGKLVASRSSQAFLAAVTLPDHFRDAPRTRVADVSKSGPTTPVFVRTKWNGEQSCHRLDFIDGPTISFRVGRDEAAPLISVTQFAFDPVTRLRYLALDGAGLPGSVAIGGPHATSRTRQSETESLDVFLWEKAEVGCTEETLRAEPPSRPLQLFFVVREVGPGGPWEIVMAPSISLMTGTTFKMRTGLRDEKTGQQRELVLSGYVSRDGTWAAVNLMATAIWINPADGGEYFFTQSSVETAPTPIALGEVVAATLSAGVAAPRPLELKMFKAGETSSPPQPK